MCVCVCVACVLHVFKLIEQVVKLVGNEVGRHGATLSCIEDVLLWSILTRWTDGTIAKLGKGRERGSKEGGEPMVMKGNDGHI